MPIYIRVMNALNLPLNLIILLETILDTNGEDCFLSVLMSMYEFDEEDLMIANGIYINKANSMFARSKGYYYDRIQKELYIIDLSKYKDEYDALTMEKVISHEIDISYLKYDTEQWFLLEDYDSSTVVAEPGRKKSAEFFGGAYQLLGQDGRTVCERVHSVVLAEHKPTDAGYKAITFITTQHKTNVVEYDNVGNGTIRVKNRDETWFIDADTQRPKRILSPSHFIDFLRDSSGRLDDASYVTEDGRKITNKFCYNQLDDKIISVELATTLENDPTTTKHKVFYFK